MPDAASQLEAQARRRIDALLEASGWTVQDRSAVNLSAAAGGALRELPTSGGEADAPDQKRVRCMAVLARPLHNEHRLKNTQQLIKRSLRQIPQSLDETVPIDHSQLISHNMAVFAVKAATHTKRVWMSASCERRNHESAKVSIQLVRRHYDTRPRLPDFRSSRGIQRDKEDIAS